MKLCIIGSSHVGALRKAWGNGLSEKHPDIETTWFARMQMGIAELVPKDGRLVPGNVGLQRSIEFTSGGKSAVEVDDYDAFLVYGLHGHGRYPNRNFYSSAVRSQAFIDKVTSQKNHELLQSVRSLTDKPLWTAHDPLPAFDPERVLPVDYPALVTEMQERFYSPMSISLVAQPLDTIISGAVTKAEFAQDSERLDVGRDKDGESHDEGEIFHMNTNYGHRWMDAFLATSLASL